MGSTPVRLGARYSVAARETRNSVATKALGLLWRIYRRSREEVQIRRAIRELGELDDRALKDIGLQRSEIEHRVRRGWGRRR